MLIKIIIHFFKAFMLSSLHPGLTSFPHLLKRAVGRRGRGRGRWGGTPRHFSFSGEGKCPDFGILPLPPPTSELFPGGSAPSRELHLRARARLRGQRLRGKLRFPLPHRTIVQHPRPGQRKCEVSTIHPNTLVYQKEKKMVPPLPLSK